MNYRELSKRTDARILVIFLVLVVAVSVYWLSSTSGPLRAGSEAQDASRATRVAPTKQPAPAANVTADRSALNSRLRAELDPIIATEAGDTESQDSIDRIESLLAQGADVNATEPSAEAPIILAAMNGHIIALKMLLERGANINVQDDSGRSALMYAAHVKDYRMVQLLIARGAKSDLKDDNGSTALEYARVLGGSSEPGYLKTMALLKRAASPGFKPSQVKEPSVSGPAPARALLHRDNVRRLPLARTLEDAWSLEEAIQQNSDVDALRMMQKGRFVMIPNDTEVELIEKNLLHCLVKVKSLHKTGWVRCEWIQSIS